MTASALEQPRAPRILALDGLRAIAVLGVLAQHLGYAPFAYAGKVGVFVFFTISGFIITHLLVKEYEATGCVSLKGFWLRRAARLLPPVAILVVFVTASRRLFFDTPLSESLAQAVPTMLYYANWVRVDAQLNSQPSGLGVYAHTWSLSIEEQFYLVWPLVLLTLLWVSARSRRAVLVGGVLILCVTSAVVRPLGFNPDLPYQSSEALLNRTDAMAELLLAGACVAILAWIRRSNGPTGRFDSPVLGVSALACVAVIALVPPSLTSELHLISFWTVGITVIAWANAAVCWHLLHAPGSWLSRALRLSWLIALGRISYGVYLYHYPIYHMVGPELPLPWWAADASVVALSVGVAALSWRFVEQPIIGWAKRRGADRGNQRPGMAAQGEAART